jgi:hypothetical protein
MVNLAGSRCFARFRKNILILTKPRANAQRVVKSVVIPRLLSDFNLTSCVLAN